MARYFRADSSSDPNDLCLLPRAFRDDEDIARVARQAEDDTLAAFTHAHPDPSGRSVALDCGTAAERFVWLRGYAELPFEAEPAFAAAMRREVAHVIRWRLGLERKKPGVESESGGDKTSKSYSSDSERRLPPDFGHALRPFAVGRIAWGI